MIISRTPFRVSFVGGGTDLPSYYEQFGGAVRVESQLGSGSAFTIYFPRIEEEAAEAAVSAD